jgi:hypothetical protein
VLRDWTMARGKVDAVGACRVCTTRRRLEAAHVAGRAHDGTLPTHLNVGAGVVVRAVDVVPLCTDCHQAYDQHKLDLLPYLTHAEQAAAVEYLGIVGAYRRLTGSRTPIL